MGWIGNQASVQLAGRKITQLKLFLFQVREFRRDIRLFLVYNLFSNAGIGVFILIYNLYLIQNGFAESFIGIYNATTTLALAAVAMLMGPLIGRFGGWHCITYGTIGFVVASVFLALLADPALILLISLLAGAGTAFLITPIMPFILEWERPENRGLAAAFAFSINSLSLTLGSFIGGWSPRMFHYIFGFEIQSVMSYRLALLLGLAVVALGLIPMYRMREAREQSGEEEGEFAAVVDLPATRQEVRRDIMIFAGATGVLALGVGAVVPFYNVYLNAIGLRPGMIGVVFATAGIVAAVMGLTVPSISRRWGDLAALYWIRLAPAPLFLLLVVFPHFTVAALAHIVRTTTIGMSWPLDSSVLGTILPPRARATGFSIRSGLWNLGYAISSAAGGVVIVWLGYGATFLAFAVLTFLSTFLFMRYFRNHPRLPDRTKV